MDKEIKNVYKKIIGKSLRNIRKSKLLSAEDAALGSKCSLDSIRRFEQGKCKNLDILFDILYFYDIKPHIFFKNIYALVHKKED